MICCRPLEVPSRSATPIPANPWPRRGRSYENDDEIAKWLVVLAVIAILGLGGWLWLAPPADPRRRRVFGQNSVFEQVRRRTRCGRGAAGRRAGARAPDPETGFVVDSKEGTVRARLLGLLGGGIARISRKLRLCGCFRWRCRFAKAGHPISPRRIRPRMTTCPEGQDLFADWTADDRRPISLQQLMAMSSGLEFNEEYRDGAARPDAVQPRLKAAGDVGGAGEGGGVTLAVDYRIARPAVKLNRRFLAFLNPQLIGIAAEGC